MNDRPMNEGSLLLVLDTATRTPVLALAGMDGTLLAERRWQSRHRHSEQLLEQLDQLLLELGSGAHGLAGVVVGTGPGSFTGLRIGLATAKVLAYSLSIPLAGVSTTRSLALAAVAGEGTAEVAVALPAGVADRYVHRLRVVDGRAEEPAPPGLVATPEAFAEAVGAAALVAVDLAAEDVPGEALERGQQAMAGLAATLALDGAAAIAGGQTADLAALVPAYVALPRGIRQAAEEVRWSPDLR